MNKNKMKTKVISVNNKSKILLISLFLILVLGGILAYFTDSETKNNKFTVGNVDIQLVEERWNTHLDANNNDIPDIAETLTPLKSIEKDPLIKNIGTNDAWVYLEVKIPIIKNVVVADIDGNKQPAGDVELFSFIKNEGWTEIGVKELDTSNENTVYVYGYNTALSSKQDTPTLFDSIKFANVIEGQGIENIEKTVVVTAKAIQTDGTGTMQEAYDNNFKRGQVAGDQYKEYTMYEPITINLKLIAANIIQENRNIQILDNLPDLSNIPDNYKWDLSADQSKSIMMWYVENDKTAYIGSNGQIMLGGDSSYLFSELNSIKGLELLNTSQVNNFSRMFNNCNNLTTLDVSNWNVSSGTDFYGMFAGCASLITLDVSKWDVSNGRDFSFMFYICNNLTTLDVSKWDVSSGTDFSGMFQECRILKNINLEDWNVQPTADTTYMFSYFGGPNPSWYTG